MQIICVLCVLCVLIARVLGERCADELPRGQPGPEEQIRVLGQRPHNHRGGRTIVKGKQ